MKFKEWIVNEMRDIYGFEKDKKPKEDPFLTRGSPIIPINPEVVINTMLKTPLNNEVPFSNFPDQIQWGKRVGSIRMVISPLGSFKSIIRKKITDLKGNEVWSCKRIVPYNDLLHANQMFDEKLAIKILEEIEGISKEGIEAPEKEYDGLEKLTKKVSNICRKKNIMPEIFIYKGIKQIKKNQNYLIYFECSGHGVEAPGSARVEQFIIDMSYDPKTGLIRSFGHDVQSTTRQHLWYPQPSEWDEYFSSKQSETEIAECIGAALSTY
jgi:hypothetical protein